MSLLQKMLLIVLSFLGTMASWNWLYMSVTAGYAMVAMVSFLLFGASFFYLSLRLFIEAPHARRHW